MQYKYNQDQNSLENNDEHESSIAIPKEELRIISDNSNPICVHLCVVLVFTVRMLQIHHMVGKFCGEQKFVNVMDLLNHKKLLNFSYIERVFKPTKLS